MSRGLSFLLLVLFIRSYSIPAQTTKKAPHGGNIGSSNGYHVEMVACSEYFEIYVYDNFMGPILNNGLKGCVTYHYSNKSNRREELYIWGIDGFSVKNGGDFVFCSVTLTHNGRPIQVSFANNFTCEEH